MSWSQDFCLACDRQTEGSTYCGESCRVAEYERASSLLEASTSTQQGVWTSTRSPYMFTNAAQPQPTSFSHTTRTLSPSSSQSSLLSLQSISSTTSIDSTHLSVEAAKELKAYASAFDRSRYHRRQSQ